MQLSDRVATSTDVGGTSWGGPRGRAGRIVVAAMAAGIAAGACASSPDSAATTATLAPGIVLTARQDEYVITGGTFGEVGESLRRRGPWLRNRSVSGIHSYNLRWRFTYGTEEGGCRIDSVEVDIDSTILLPRWRRPAGADPAVAEAWEVFLEGIRSHEDQHRTLAVQSALQIQRELSGLEAPSCTPTLADRANELGRRILAGFHERNREFDRTSGPARWPPYGYAPD